MISQARGLRRGLGPGAPFLIGGAIGAKFCGFAFELRDAFCGTGQLLIERRLFPLERVDLAVRFVEFALPRGHFLRGRGMFGTRLLQLLANLFQTFNCARMRLLVRLTAPPQFLPRLQQIAQLQA